MGLQNHAGKRKQYGKFFIPGLPGHMSFGSGSGLGSTLYTRHQHHAEPKFCAAVVFRRCPSALLPGCSCTVGERSTEVDCCIFCNREAISGGSTVGWIGAWVA